MENYIYLNDAAQSFLRDYPIKEMQQVLVTMRLDGIIEKYVNDLSEQSEKAFLARQTEPLRALFCVWNNNVLDVPSYRLREGLVARFPENRNCVVYLQGPDGVLSKMLSATMTSQANK